MKINFWIFIVLIFFALSCDQGSDPDYPAEPFIESGDIEFIDVANWSTDTIRLTFKFRDGDFDLGLSHTDIDSPYHQMYFFLEKNGSLTKMVTKKVYDDSPPLLYPSGKPGKLATFKYLDKVMQDPPAIEWCVNYTYEFALYLSAADQSMLDESHTVDKILKQPGRPDIYKMSDTVLIEHNPHFTNIVVDYLVEQPDGSYAVRDLQKEFCTSFNGRFPFLMGTWTVPTITSGPFKIRRYTSQKGEMLYTMASAGFKQLFGGRKIKIRVSIKDRALNESNVYETSAILIPN